MFFVVIGALLIPLKYFEVWRFAELDWWWVIAPLVIAFLWFEVFEGMLGFDKRKLGANDPELAKKARIKAQFVTETGKGKRAKA